MRRRFGRGRRGRGGAGEGKASPIDAARVLARIVEEGIVEAEALAPVGDGADGLAALGTGTAPDGRALVVGFAPRHGGHAALAAVAHALGLGEGFDGEVIAVAPQWDGAARRLLGQLGALPFPFRALAASSLAESRAAVEPERVAAASGRPRQASAGLGAAEQGLFARAAAAFEGLAAKHGGSVRARGRDLELVLMARCVAVLRAGEAGVVLETLLPDRASAPLRSDDLSTAMDRLEGALRKRLNDRRVRGSEEGLRSDVAAAFVEAADLRASLRWPLAGSDPEILDLAGVRADGGPVIAAARTRLGLAGLAAILDAAGRLEPTLPLLLAECEPPARPDPPRLLLAAREWEGEVLALLPALELACECYDVTPGRGRGPGLERREGAAVRPPARRAEPAAAEPAAAEPAAAPAVEPGEAAAEPAAEAGRSGRGEPRFDEISLFDVEDEAGGGGEEAGGRRRRRSRGRRRGRRGASGGGSEGAAREPHSAPDPEARPEAGEEAEEARAETGARRGRARGRRRSRAPAVDESDDDEVIDADDDLDLGLAPLDEDVPDPEEAARARYPTSEGEEDEEEEVDEEAEEPAAAAPEPEAAREKPKPRRRAAIVAHADRDSILAAILLARDVRLVEGFWIYPQEDLMTFFRGVATDLREETPIWLVGFQASPAIDILPAASLYQGRLGWFDHHDWPPEDLERMRQAIGAENLVVHAGAGSSLPGVLSVRTRRSRFSDKLVELATGRFSQHDYERWGRLWWHRLGELATKRGEHRRDIDPLLAGRPSDLAREASGVELPPLPPEVEHVSGRDFRLVHFAGYTLSVVPVPPGLDLHLCARIARERYEADISVAFAEGRDLVVLAVDESRGPRGMDVGRLVDHLASKHGWIEPLPNDDHVARMRVHELAVRDERLDEVIREIAMSRSALEA